MKIAYILKYPFQYSETFVCNEVIELIRRGNEIVIFPMWEPEGKRNDKNGELHGLTQYFSYSLFRWGCFMANLREVFRNPVEYVRIYCDNHSFIGNKFFFISMEIADRIRVLKIDHIHSYFATFTATRARVISNKIGIPFSCTASGSDVLINPPEDLIEIIEESGLFVTVSHHMKTFLLRKFRNLNSGKIKVLFLGVDTDFFKPPIKLQEYVERYTILSVARLHKIKGLDNLIRVCMILKQKGMQFKCIIVGSGDEELNLKHLVRQLKLQDCVTFAGQISHVKLREFYQLADVFVLPSLSEGIPVSAMEAMSMEVPVIVSDITGLSELVDEGINGYLVTPGKQEIIADRIFELYQNRDKARAIGKKGRTKVVAEFELRNNVGALEKLFEQSVSGNLGKEVQVDWVVTDQVLGMEKLG